MIKRLLYVFLQILLLIVDLLCVVGFVVAFILDIAIYVIWYIISGKKYNAELTEKCLQFIIKIS
jgi:hypothetical protein